MKIISKVIQTKLTRIALFLLLFLPLLSSAQFPTTAHFLDNYSMKDYSILKVDNRYYVAGTLYKSPVNSTLLGAPVQDSCDLHLLELDDYGNILNESVFDNGLNNSTYDIFRFEASPGKDGFIVLCGGEFSGSVNTIMLNFDFSLGLIQMKECGYMNSNVSNTTLQCLNIGLRTVHCFSGLQASNGNVYVVGMNSDPLWTTPNIHNLNKGGFISCYTQNLNHSFNKIIANNDPNIPCNIPLLSNTNKDFECINDIIDVDGQGLFLSGTVNAVGQNSIHKSGAVAVLLDYSGNIIHDWSFVSVNNSNKNIYSVAAYYSTYDNFIYQLSNDNYENSLIVRAYDPNSGSIINDMRLDYDFANPDIELIGFNILEDVNPNYITIIGYGSLLGGNWNSSLHQENLKYITINKYASVGQGFTMLSAGSYDCSGIMGSQGNCFGRIDNNEILYYTPKIAQKSDVNNILAINYEGDINTTNKGIRFVSGLYGNGNNVIAENSCNDENWNGLTTVPINDPLPLDAIDYGVTIVPSYLPSEVQFTKNDVDCYVLKSPKSELNIPKNALNSFNPVQYYFVYDCLGRLLKKCKSNLELQELPAGVYVIHEQNSNGNIFSRRVFSK
jgi:hypothetical protein